MFAFNSSTSAGPVFADEIAQSATRRAIFAPVIWLPKELAAFVVTPSAATKHTGVAATTSSFTESCDFGFEKIWTFSKQWERFAVSIIGHIRKSSVAHAGSGATLSCSSTNVVPIGPVKR